VAVVTGAASGIGRSLAIRIAEERIAGSLSPTSTAGPRRNRGSGPKIRHFRFQTHRRHFKTRSARAIKNGSFGRALARHAFGHNAGVALMGTFEQISLSDFEWLMGINFWGVVYGCKFFCRF
jgi:NAD(P)-dependent dehydrogenase (short-subunit alcohol dehydrogenase family)